MKKIILFISILLLLIGCDAPQQVDYDPKKEPRMTCTLVSEDINIIKDLKVEYYGEDDEAQRIVQTIKYSFENDKEKDKYLKVAQEFSDKYKDHPYIKHSITQNKTELEEILDVNVKESDIEDLVEIKLLPDSTSKSVSMGLMREQFEEKGIMKCQMVGEKED